MTGYDNENFETKVKVETVSDEQAEPPVAVPVWQGKPKYSKFRRAGEIVLVIFSIVCLWITLLALWRTPGSRRNMRYERKTLTCGNSTDEAKARGCVWDLLANNWVAPQCVDEASEAEYRAWLFSPERAHGPFPFFEDIEGKHHIEDEHALSLHANGATEHDRRVYTTREQHLNHCIFVMRKLHRAMEGNAILNDEHNSMKHTQHCLDQLQLTTNQAIMGKLVEECYIGFSDCTIEVPV